MIASVNERTQVQLLSLDFGNFELKAYDGRSVSQIRSLQKQLATGERELRGTDTSPVIEMDGDRWHVGSQCTRYPSYEATVQGEKSKLAQLHLAACIDRSGRYSLVLSHHSPGQYADFLKGALIGTHSYSRNGQPIQVSVESVEVIPEGQGAYALAKSRNYIPQRGYTILIDLGGSTWLSSLYASDGELVSNDPHEREGTYALALAIASDTRLSKPLQDLTSVSSPNPVVIQDGFCNGHFYGESDLCWGEWLPEYLDPWFKGIMQTIKSKYQTYLPNVKRFIITGGGSTLVSPKVAASTAFLVMPEASTANVIGGYLAAQSRVAA